MRIVDAIFSKGLTGFYFDDQRAIKRDGRRDGFAYGGRPVTEGFSAVRQAGESISVMLLLENGAVAVGDCAAVQYSGAGGRDPLFLGDRYQKLLQEQIRPLLVDRELSGFRDMARWIDELQIDGERLHTAIRYGVSQALLSAHAQRDHTLMMEVVCKEYGLPLIAEAVPLFGQTGYDRYDGADKMIIKEVDVLPHGLVNNVDAMLGRKGEKLSEYVAWLRDRIRRLRRSTDYQPDLHIDVYGTIGEIFTNDPGRIADYLGLLEEESGEFKLYIEGPVDMEAKAPQIETLQAINEALHKKGIRVGIVADEWCNTYEDIRDFTDARCCHMVQIKTPDLGSIHNVVDSILYCKSNGMECYQGGTSNETDVSARACLHVALAARAERVLAKPGMGFDEGLMIVKNEMNRALAMLRARPRSA